MNVLAPRLLRFLPLAGSLSLLGCASVARPDPAPFTPPIAVARSNLLLPSVAVPVSTSQTDGRATRQPWELTVGGAGTNNQDFNAGGAQLAGSIGYYLNEVVELSVRQNLSYGDAGAGTSGAWDGISRGAIDFHLPLGRFVPYAGANLGYAYGDTLKETFIAGPEAGVKVYLKDDVFLQAGAEYEFFFDKSDRVDDAFQDGQLIYALSMGARF